MKTLDYSRVRTFSDGLNGKLDQCDHGEVGESAAADRKMRVYADACCEFVNAVCGWGADVFCGRVAFDRTTEQMWRAELERLLSRANTLAELGFRSGGPCRSPDEEDRLQAAIWKLHRLRDNWVSPSPAVAPSARNLLSDAVAAAARERIAKLPPLPADWTPSDDSQKNRLAAIRAERTAIQNDRS